MDSFRNLGTAHSGDTFSELNTALFSVKRERNHTCDLTELSCDPINTFHDKKTLKAGCAQVMIPNGKMLSFFYNSEIQMQTEDIRLAIPRKNMATNGDFIFF